MDALGYSTLSTLAAELAAAWAEGDILTPALLEHTALPAANLLSADGWKFPARQTLSTLALLAHAGVELAGKEGPDEARYFHLSLN